MSLSTIFGKVKFLAIQQPLILLVSMLTGKDVTEILALNIHQRLVLIREVVFEVLQVVEAGVEATDPAGDGGVTLTEDELAKIIDEADDVGPAVDNILETFRTKPEPGADVEVGEARSEITDGNGAEPSDHTIDERLNDPPPSQ